jgi:protein-disulfide isomerase
MDKKPTKRELKELRRMENEAKKRSTVAAAESKPDEAMKWVTLGIVAVIVVGLLGFIIYNSIQKNAEKQRLANTALNISNTGYYRGATASAQVTLTEFGDLQCPACKANEPFMRQALADFPNTLRLQFKQFPLTTVHRNAMAAAKAAEAAGAQGKFWELHDLLYERQEVWGESSNPTDTFIGYARELGLDTDRFQEDMNDPKTEKKIQAEMNEGINLGVNATPTLYVNGKMVQTGDYAALKDAIQKEIKK